MNAAGKELHAFREKMTLFPVDSGIDRVDAMRISHTTHNSMVQVSYGVLPHHGSRSAATARRVRVPSRPPSRPQPRPPPAPTARAEGVRLRRRLEVNGARV